MDRESGGLFRGGNPNIGGRDGRFGRGRQCRSWRGLSRRGAGAQRQEASAYQEEVGGTLQEVVCEEVLH